jgi:low temperature requirement protein LtrA
VRIILHVPEHSPGAPLRARIRPRSPLEPHRVASPLELFFDLVFVVAIAQAAAALHHAIADAHALDGLAGYAMVFFAIWWAWVNFAWFASAYETGGVPYRLAVFVRMSGALLMAAGVPAMFETRTPNLAIVAGYVVMRAVSVAQWLRVAANDPERRTTARRYAFGTAAVQTAWAAMLLAPAYWVPGFLALAALELALPAWAERAAATPWHPHHIAERYGLLTLIVLGESILSANATLQSALAAGASPGSFAGLIVGGLLTVYSMWWIYFDRPVHDLLTGLGRAFVWGYGHYFVFGAAAGVGAGLAVNIDFVTGRAKIGALGAGLAVAIPVAIYLLSLWVLHDRPEHRRTRLFGPTAAILVLLSPFTGQAVPATGAILGGLIAAKLWIMRTARERRLESH